MTSSTHLHKQNPYLLFLIIQLSEILLYENVPSMHTHTHVKVIALTKKLHLSKTKRNISERKNYKVERDKKVTENIHTCNGEEIHNVQTLS